MNDNRYNRLRDLVNEEVYFRVPTVFLDTISSSSLENEWYEFLSSVNYGDEIFEFYFVSEWLAKKLSQVGEAVMDVETAWIWGRTTTGQMIAMDHTMANVLDLIDGVYKDDDDDDEDDDDNEDDDNDDNE